MDGKVKGMTACRVPDAQPEVAKDTNVPNNDCISRQAAIDAILAVTGNSSVRELYEHVQEHGLSEQWSGGVNAAIDIIIAVPSTQPEITPDGTLNVSIDADIVNVGRILLSQAGTQCGGLYYKDEQPEETCDTCKHGYFGDGKCDYCRVRYPSHYERRTDEPD